MSLFGNQNFMKQIAREVGCPNMAQEVLDMMQTLVQIETRKLIQRSGKFMHNDRRDQIDFEDLNTALNELGHSDISLVEQQQQYIRDGSFYIRRDPIYKSAKQLIEEELKTLSVNFSTPPKLRARWIYIDGKIPKTNDNKSLKCKSEILSIRQKQLGQKNKKFNIIMDQPEAMLTGFQLQYYREVTTMLSEGNENIGKLSEIDVTGNLSNLFPLFLKYFLSSQITDIKMTYFLSLLQNKYVEISVEYHLHQILTYLWAYQGNLSFKIGETLGRYIKVFSHKYPFLYTIWGQSSQFEYLQGIQQLISEESRNTAYYNTIKRIAIQLTTGIQINIDHKILKQLEEDTSNNLKSAQLCKEVMVEYWGHINCLKGPRPESFSSGVYEEGKYWLPSEEMKFADEKYLTMGL